MDVIQMSLLLVKEKERHQKYQKNQYTGNIRFGACFV
jgi:hypothetical protein